MLSRELPNPVFTDIAFGAGHPQYQQREEEAGSRGPTSKDPILQVENLFSLLFYLEINLKTYEKIDGNGVLE